MYFDALIQLSDFYLDNQESDKAFQTISRAVQLVPSIQDKFESVKKWKVRKPVTLYNLSVEEDESYIAKGVVVHNCRCIALPYKERK